MRWISSLMLLAIALSAHAESAKVLKVLPQFLDAKGRSSISPSLFDRDAYQAHLRDSPTNQSALRFNVDWKARGYDELTLRVETKGGSARRPKLITLETNVHPHFFSQWTSFTISGDAYKQFGTMIAWRATLWHGTNQVAEQKSFLW